MALPRGSPAKRCLERMARAREKDVDGARAAIERRRGRERQDLAPTPQPHIDLVLEHRPALAGALPLAVHEAHAAAAAADAGFQEFIEREPCDRNRHAVQVELRFHGVRAVAKLADDTELHPGLPEHELFAGLDAGGIE